MSQETKQQYITKDMIINDLVANYPSATEILMAEGVHCVGCGAAGFETIGMGLGGHGKTDEQIRTVIEKMNEVVELEQGKKEEPKEEAKAGGNIIITEAAAAKVSELLKKQGKEDYGLRIEVVAGGCSGMSYNFQFDKERKEGDQVQEIKGVKFFVDGKSAELLNGSTVDFVDSLQESGFKVTNPNAHSSCGCGKSFS